MLAGTILFDGLTPPTAVTLGVLPETATAALAAVWLPTDTAALTRRFLAGLATGTLVSCLLADSAACTLLRWPPAVVAQDWATAVVCRFGTVWTAPAVCLLTLRADTLTLTLLTGLTTSTADLCRLSAYPAAATLGWRS